MGGFGLALAVLIFLIILQQVDGNIIIPRLLGKSLNLNPVMIILAITIGGAYYGILGMFVSVPVVAVIKIILSDLVVFVEARNAKKRGVDPEAAEEAKAIEELTEDMEEQAED
jgi:predicted PurR-regulated permease PerM